MKNTKKTTKKTKNTPKVVAQVKAIVLKPAKAQKPVAQKVKKQPSKDMLFKNDKNTVIRPNCLYTENEVRGFLCLGKKSYIVPSKFTGIHVNGGMILGRDIIAHLERVTKTQGRGRRSAVKIGRRYKSGSVTVVAR